MELSERFIKEFEQEFTYVYEVQDAPGKVYPEHVHKDNVSVYITDGSLIFDFSGELQEIEQNKRFNIPPGISHTVTAGAEGAIYIVGEMQDEDV